MAFGTGVAWSAPSGPRLIKGNEYGFQITDEQFSWIGSAMTLGAGISYFACIPFDKSLKANMFLNHSSFCVHFYWIPD